MIEISNRHLDLIIEKLPRVLAMAKMQETTLQQSEDIRQLQLLHRKLKKKKFNIKKQKL